jgi:hypothetical protein
MVVDNVILMMQSAALTAAAGLFIYKYSNVQKFKARYKNVGSRWVFWYFTSEILGTSSPSRRVFMLTHNRLSTLMWTCVLLLIILFLAPHDLYAK